MESAPDARNNEIEMFLDWCAIDNSHNVLDLGAGSGHVLSRLADRYHDSVLWTWDAIKGNLDAAIRRVPEVRPLASLDDKKYATFFDQVVSLATFHHFDDYSTGHAGRQGLLSKLTTLLKPGGHLTIADVMANTGTARYFEAIDDPLLCAPDGHPHAFIEEDELTTWLTKAGFTLVELEHRPTPWTFASRDTLTRFMARLHNARVPHEEVEAFVDEHLGITTTDDGKLTVGWSLVFVRAVRSDS